MSKRRIVKNTRASLQNKIEKAREKKPTAGDLNKKGLTAEQIQKLFGEQTVIPNNTKRILNNRGRYQKVHRTTFYSRKVTKPNLNVVPNVAVYNTPAWFTNNREVDVSIIVPMYKSRAEIKEQIESWDLEADGLTKEIIYVDDKCPQESYKTVLWTWERKTTKYPIGKIILNGHNSGYGPACNAGASFAKGKYLIFLNADCKLTKNWIKPMVDLIEDNKDIGIVGNMQIRSNGNIDSVGSEWNWATGSFEHIGKTIYRGKRLGKPFTVNNLPEELRKPAQREMVTGCCFLIPKSLFECVGGFDSNFKIGYWEDSDLNLKVQAIGRKVFIQPESVIYHKVGHTKSGGHAYANENREYFAKKWIETGRIDKYIQTPRTAFKHKTIKDNVQGKVVGCVIACNEEEFLEASVDSVSSLVDEWIFVIGGNNYAYKANMCDKKGYPNDNTLEIAHKLVAKYGGRVIEPPGRLWKDKIEMRAAYAKYLFPGDWMFMLDGDEVYDENQLWKVTELMKTNEVLILQFWLFWNKMNVLGSGAWDNYPQERIVRWREGYGYHRSHLSVSDSNDRIVNSYKPCYRGQEKLFYHYSWIRPLEKIIQKREYYKYQSGNKNDTYVDNVFLKWRESPESVRGKTHPMGGGEWTPFTGEHPENIKKLILDGKLNF